MTTIAIRRVKGWLPLALMVWFTGAASAASVVVPEGTVLAVTMDSTLNSATNHVGDRFTATVSSTAGIPAGAKIEGVVRSVQRAGGGEPGMLDVDFDTMRLPDGQKYSMRGSLISLEDKNLTRAADGRLVAKTKRANRDKFIAYGAGAGLVIGALTKSNIITGTLLGAAAGWIYHELNKNKARPTDVTVNPGTEFGVRLDRELAYVETAAEIRVMMDRQQIALGSARPITDRGHVLVPMRPVLDEAAVAYRFDAKRKIVRVERDDADVYLKVGQSYALVDGERDFLETPAQLRSGVLYVPLRFVELATGKEATWDANLRVVSLITPRSIASR